MIERLLLRVRLRGTKWRRAVDPQWIELVPVVAMKGWCMLHSKHEVLMKAKPSSIHVPVVITRIMRIREKL